MDENPYQSPATPLEAIGVLSGKREDLSSVAMCQKGILVCILIYLVAMGFQFALPPRIRLLFGVGVLLVGLAGTILVILLAIKVYNVVLGVLLGGVLLGILTFIPCLGLLILWMVNGKATTILKQNGIKVGLLGANLADIE